MLFYCCEEKKLVKDTENRFSPFLLITVEPTSAKHCTPSH